MTPKPRGSNLKAILLLMLGACGAGLGSELPGFQVSGQFREQLRSWTFEPGVTVTVVAPAESQFDPSKPTLLAIYALPNGNSTEQTLGKARAAGLDWHFDIQHIGAQARALRAMTREGNLVMVYLENDLKSWPSWRERHPESPRLIRELIELLRQAVPGVSAQLCLTGHSGGGSFTFGYIDAVEEIPGDIVRIAFLDSNYAYDAEKGHPAKLISWLKGDAARRLVILAYDDRSIELNGKKVVSETGGTYRATLRMLEALSPEFAMQESAPGSYRRFACPQIEMLIHRNPDNLILHTALVGEKNGFMRALMYGTPWEKTVASLEGPRAYVGWVEQASPGDTAAMTEPALPATAAAADSKVLPPRPAGALTGSQFIDSVKDLEREAREAAMLKELNSGNLPSFLRRLVPVTVQTRSIDGVQHTAVYAVMPDYLSIGSDEDFVRMPMNPYTAQAFCDAFGFVMPTRKMVNDIWTQATAKLMPQPLTRQRESPVTFLQSHRLIEEQRTGQRLWELRAGIKKDLVITNRLQERPNRVAIFGWHYPSGESIQPLTTVHVDWYVDYSHGIRPVRNRVVVDGTVLSFDEVLRDPHLNVLLSDEGVIQSARYVRR